MKIRDLFNYVHKLKEDPFEDSELLMWLNEVEGLVHTKVFLLAPSEYKEITADDIDSDTFKLLIVGPHQKIYSAYLVAMIDFANGEYNRYANTLEMFNAHFTELQMWQRQYAGPADGECVFRGYYLSAYGIAKSHGFIGSEEEWLASLKGDKGDSAYDIAVKLGYKGTEQEWIAYLEKAQTDAIDAALKSALEELSDQRSTSQGLIDFAREEALQIIRNANSALSSNLDAYHSGMEDHYQYISAELGSVRDESIDAINEAKNDAIDEIGLAAGIVQTPGNDATKVMSQKASSNAFANALKGTASGEAIAILDASPVEHEMDVKARSKNLANIYGFSAEGLKTPEGKRSLTNNYGTTISTTEPSNSVVITQTQAPGSGTTYTNGFIIIGLYNKLKDGDSITLSFDLEVTNNPLNAKYMGLSLNNGTMRSFAFANGRCAWTFPWEAGDGRQTIEIRIAGCSCVISNIQLEEGTTATAYAPYIDDISTVKVKKYGKNILDVSTAKLIATRLPNAFTKERTQDGIKTTVVGDRTFTETAYAGYRIGSFEELKGKTLTVSFGGVASDASLGKRINAIIYDDSHSNYENDGYVGNSSYYRIITYANNTNTVTFTVPTEADARYNNVGITLAVYPGGVALQDGNVTEYTGIQVEIGDSATGFESSKGATEYEVSADGTVKGVTSLYPTTTLITDTAGAVINCTYNRDINKAFEELYNAIISTGGNV